MGAPEQRSTFDEVLDVLRGLIRKRVEATMFLPEDEGRLWGAHIGGVLRIVTEAAEGSLCARVDASPSDLTITVWGQVAFIVQS